MAVKGSKCPYCQASHFPDKCDVVTNLETRKVAEERFELHQQRTQFKKLQIKKDLFQV